MRYLLLTAILAFSAGSVQAAMPLTLSFQGVLTDTSGTPKADGSYSASFALYNALSGGVAVWSGSGTVSVTDGLFSTTLTIGGGVAFDAPYWLQTTIGGTTLSPRIPLASGAYSFRALRADTASYVNGSGLTGLNASQITSGTLADARLEATVDVTVLNASDYITASGGLHVGGTSDPGTDNLAVDGYVYSLGGLHVGGTSSPGTDNLAVDGYAYTLGGLYVGNASDAGSGNLGVTGVAGIGSSPSATYNLRVSGSSPYGIYVDNSYDGTSSKYGTRNWVSTDGTGSRYGTYNYVYSNTAGDFAYGIYNFMSRNGYSGTAYGVYNNFYGTPSSGTEYGIYCAGEDYNYFSGNVGIGTITPTYPLTIDQSAVSVGMYQNNTYTGASSKYGLMSYVDAGGTGIRYGLYSNVYANASDASSCYGVYSYINQSTSSASTYGLRLSSSGTGTGTKYGIYTSGEDVNYLGGSLGILTASVGSYELYVSGQSYCTGGFTGSDRRWKKNIQPLTGMLDKVKSLQGVTYDWRIDEFPENGFDEGTQVGLIAQEVEKVLPELVKENADGYKAVAYDKLVAVLIEAVKEQQQTIETLRAESSRKDEALIKTDSELQGLKGRMDILEKMVEKLAGSGNEKVSLR